ncbi:MULTISPECIES: triacylglycerol lipase [unclassified Polaromonas]|uniref:esterase/lipase family protein n=1 Tax=unclassified Polaromonas TaxID=2638319 RepID=UPI000F082E9C|nr:MULTISPECIES: alpha/beta fold hydrolase [unclassified Polaromonas]AYQ28146.1 alpha/beta fold hydrolase [Polaromonas sp. SP1]QGJ16991.1 alpha/beta fold hydrolase [Polaromonas sp. Pch-P]
MLAHLQRLITLTLIAAAFGWLVYFRGSSPALAVTGFFVIALGYTAFLALEFLLLHHINKADPAPQPTWKELLRAWVGETLTAPRVFCWRQPFRTNAVPDQLAPAAGQGRRGVVFVHGFFCNRGLWTPWLQRVRADGRVFVAVNLEPLFGSIDDYAPQIDEAVRQVTEATGLPPLLVCHSMGGLAARAWLKRMKAEARVHHVVTIGTPHGGTWLARFGHGHNGRQMRLQSDWQSQLDHEMPVDRHALFTCWYSNCDNIVFPTSTATLVGADNRLVRGAAHVQMAFLPEVMNATLAMLDGKPA